jgi:hypothetical protein
MQIIYSIELFTILKYSELKAMNCCAIFDTQNAIGKPCRYLVVPLDI